MEIERRVLGARDFVEVAGTLGPPYRVEHEAKAQEVTRT